MPGVYAAMLEVQREKYNRYGEVAVFDGRERRVTWVDRADQSQGFYLHSRDALDLFEAAKTVNVGRGAVEEALWFRDRPGETFRPAERAGLPFGRAVRRLRVSPDDRVRSAPDRPRSRAVASVDIDGDGEP
jgi:hypothetical protein